jgi:glycosyltransferase involved in cell wall biosynthesis
VRVTLITPTRANGFDDASLPFRVARAPNLVQLVRLLREADIVHLAGPAFLPLLLGLLLRKTVVVEHHGFQAVCPNGQMFYEPAALYCPGHFRAGRHIECLRCNAAHGRLHSFWQWLLTFPRRWMCTHAAANITPTHWLARVLELPRAVTIHHGVPMNIVARPPELSPPVSIAFVGRLVTAKGVRVLLDAAAHLRRKGLHFELRIVGDGPERRSLETWVAQSGLADCVRFLGAPSCEEMPAALDGVSVLVQPSLAGEVFGLAVAENMAQGRLPVVSDIGSLAEVVGDARLTFPAGDSAVLAARLEEVLLDPPRIRALGRTAAARSAEHFALGRMIEEHLTTYGRVLLERGLLDKPTPTVSP